MSDKREIFRFFITLSLPSSLATPWLPFSALVFRVTVLTLFPSWSGVDKDPCWPTWVDRNGWLWGIPSFLPPVLLIFIVAYFNYYNVLLCVRGLPSAPQRLDLTTSIITENFLRHPRLPSSAIPSPYSSLLLLFYFIFIRTDFFLVVAVGTSIFSVSSPSNSLSLLFWPPLRSWPLSSPNNCIYVQFS